MLHTENFMKRGLRYLTSAAADTVYKNVLAHTDKMPPGLLTVSERSNAWKSAFPIAA